MRSLCNSTKGHFVAPFLNNQSDSSKVPQTVILPKKKKKKKGPHCPLWTAQIYTLHVKTIPGINLSKNNLW